MRSKRPPWLSEVNTLLLAILVNKFDGLAFSVFQHDLFALNLGTSPVHNDVIHRSCTKIDLQSLPADLAFNQNP